MPLSDGYIDLPPGKLANVVTCMEMRERAALRPEPPAVKSMTIVRLDVPDAARFRALVRRVGEAYLWQSPLTPSDEEIEASMRAAGLESFVLVSGDTDEGIVQLDFREPGECEVRLFGVCERLQGTGAARRLMNFAIERVWSRPISRLWLHTCTLDHPGAVPFYVRSGFVPYKRQIEVHDDPRLTGLHPRTAAPHIPIL